MTYNASSELVSKIIKLSAEIVVGLGTSVDYPTLSRLYESLEHDLEQLDVAETEPAGRFERALVKAANRSAQNYRLEIMAGALSVTSDFAAQRNMLNFDALSKALMAFDSGEAKSVVDLMLPTIYVWCARDREDAAELDESEAYTTAIFVDGRPFWDNSFGLGGRDVVVDQAMSHWSFLPEGEGVTPQVVESEPPKPYLYILMRNDLASLNAGKAVAQGTHAANQMVGDLRKEMGRQLVFKPGSIHAALNVWEHEARHFGTCIVLSVNEAQMRASVAKALGDALPSHAGICHDPTYPLMDGKTLHLIPVDTCAYVFDYPARAKRHLVGYPLMP